MNCPKCNNIVEKNTKFCGFCGTEVVINKTSQSSQFKNFKYLNIKSRKYYIFAALAILFSFFMPTIYRWLSEEIAWKKTVSENKTQSYWIFIDKYGRDSKYYSKANFKIDSMLNVQHQESKMKIEEIKKQKEGNINSIVNNDIDNRKKSEYNKGRTAVINDPDGYTNIRKDKGTNFPVVKRIFRGEQFTVYPSNEKWWIVKTSDGQAGYIFYDRVEFVGE